MKIVLILLLIVPITLGDFDVKKAKAAVASDLAELTLVAAPDSVQVNGEITYAVSYKNISAQALINARVSTPVPSATDYLASPPASNEGIHCENKVLWDIPSLQPNATFTANFRVRVLAAGETPTPGPACPPLPGEGTTLVGTLDQTAISLSNNTYGLKNLTGGAEALIAENNVAKLSIKISTSVDYQPSLAANYNTWDADNYYVSQSALDLQRILAKISGASFTLSKVANNAELTSGIVLALINDLPVNDQTQTMKNALVINAFGDGREAFYIKTEANRILIVGNTGYGISHGIQMFLRTFGYRQFFENGARPILNNEKNWEIIPTASKLSANVHATDRPAFLQHTYITDSRDVDRSTPNAAAEFSSWSRALFLGNSQEIVAGHAYQKLWQSSTVEEFYKHPEYILGWNAPDHRFDNLAPDDLCRPVDVVYNNVSYTHVINPICQSYKPDFSIPAVRDMWITYLKTQIDAAPNGEVAVSLSPTDGDKWNLDQMSDKEWYVNWCNAEGRGLGVPPVSTFDSNYASDQAFATANYMAAKLGDYYKNNPNKALIFGVSAYFRHSQPPHFGLVSSVNVLVTQTYCGYDGCGIENVGLWSAWKTRLGQNTVLLFGDSYNIPIWQRDFPPSTIPTTHDGFQAFFVDKLASLRGLKGTMVTDMGLGGLGYYMLALSMWDPQIDYDALREDFLKKSFGSAWQAMDTYYNMVSSDNLILQNNYYYSLAVKQLDQAAQIADSSNETAVNYRINDLKYLWYYMYLYQQILYYPANTSAQTDFLDLHFKQGLSHALSWVNMNQLLCTTSIADTGLCPLYELNWNPTVTPKIWGSACP